MKRRMRPSGVEWIGDIPEGWRVVRFNQAISRIGTGLNPRQNFTLTKDDPLYYVTIRNFKDGHLFLDERCDRISKDAWRIIQERSNLKYGDILFASISDTPQAYLVDNDVSNWNINESVYTIRVDPELYNNRYFYYQLICTAFYDNLLVDATGSTFQSIKQHKLLSSLLTLPPLCEQKRAAEYLDSRCAEIDAAIDDARKVIEEYNVLKKSLVFEAVTGKNLGLKMKPSGITWIGDIPEGWGVSSVRFLLREINNRSSTGKEEPLSMSQLHGVVPSSMITVANPAASFIGAKLVQKGDLVFNKLKAHLGVFAVSSYEGLVSPDYAVYHSTSLSDVSFLSFLFHTPQCIAEFRKRITGVGQGLSRLYTSDLCSIKVPLPSLAEQKRIAAYLHEKVAAIGDLISGKESLVEELQSYKKSLIFEVVTGKREVA